MNVDAILQALNEEQVDYMLIGGMNFLLRHLPELTFDVDIWVRDTPDNLEKTNRALQRIGAQWGVTEKDWQLVSADPKWLLRQGCFCLTTKHGALDIFRDVRGLEGRYEECKAAAVAARTGTGINFAALSDAHMLACQEALLPHEQKAKRMEVLRQALKHKQ